MSTVSYVLKLRVSFDYKAMIVSLGSFVYHIPRNIKVFNTVIPLLNNLYKRHYNDIKFV